MPQEHLRVVPVHSYYTDRTMGIPCGRRVIGYRAKSADWRGPFRVTRPEAVEDMAGRKAVVRMRDYTLPPAA